MHIKWTATLDAGSPDAETWGDGVVVADKERGNELVIRKAIELVTDQFNRVLRRELLGEKVE